MRVSKTIIYEKYDHKKQNDLLASGQVCCYNNPKIC